MDATTTLAFALSSITRSMKFSLVVHSFRVNGRCLSLFITYKPFFSGLLSITYKFRRRPSSCTPIPDTNTKITHHGLCGPVVLKKLTWESSPKVSRQTSLDRNLAQQKTLSVLQSSRFAAKAMEQQLAHT